MTLARDLIHAAGSKADLLDALRTLRDRGPSEEAALHGARSISETMRETNHIVRAKKCYDAMLAELIREIEEEIGES